MERITKGTAALPARSYRGDTDTGHDSLAPNQLDAVVGGVSVQQIKTTEVTQQVPLNVNGTGCRNMKIAKVALGVLDTAGGILSWANPEGADIFIVDLYIDLTTVSTGACTADFGTTASSATTSSDNLIDGKDLNAATGLFNNNEDKGSNGKSKQRLASGKWLTGSKASGAAAGLVGFAYICYVVI